MKKNVLLAGASGLVGGHALDLLLEQNDVDKIIIVARRSQNLKSPKIVEVIGELSELHEKDLRSYGVDHIDVGLCALGSTIKKAGSKEAFKKVDKDYVLEAGKFSKRFGAQSFSVISSLGADKDSPIFYNKTKGEMEEGLRAMNFKTLTIIRPSLLIGERKEVRVAEKFFIKLSPILNKTMIGPLKKYRGIEAHKVAAFLTESVSNQESGVVIIENSQMLAI